MKETKDLLKLIFHLVKIAEQAKADGKIDVADAGLLLSLLPDLGPALSGLDLIPGEFKALDKAQADDLLAFIKQEFDIADDKLEGAIEKGLEIAKDLASLFGLLK